MSLYEQQISKQATRIKLLSANLSKKHPHLSSQIDQIIRASLKVQKIVSRAHSISSAYAPSPSRFDQTFNTQRESPFTAKNKQIQLEEEFPVSSSNDDYYRQAVQKINSINNKIAKLDRKVNIVFQETEFKRLKKSQSIKNVGFSDYKKQIPYRQVRVQKLTLDRDEQKNKYKQRLNLKENKQSSRRKTEEENNERKNQNRPKRPIKRQFI